MGDRGQVKLGGVYLYTHWGATELPAVVKLALARRKRWDDEEYLARIIFCEMVKDDRDGTEGYGISIDAHGDVWRIVEVDVSKQTVTVKDEGEPDKPYTFESFIATDK